MEKEIVPYNPQGNSKTRRPKATWGDIRFDLMKMITMKVLLTLLQKSR